MNKWVWNKSVLWQGDCLELLPKVQDRSVDMVLCDLPYGTTSCKWDKKIDIVRLWEQYLRVIKPNGAIILTASQPFTTELINSNPKLFKYEWIWVKNTCTGFQMSKTQPLKKHENVLVFSEGKMSSSKAGFSKRMLYYPQGLVRIDKKVSKRASKEDCIIHIKRSSSHIQEFTNYPMSVLHFKKENGLHPTQKPVPLFEYLIQTYSTPGGVVLDNCSGSGTTGIACLNTNRRFILMEQDSAYVERTVKRIREHLKSMKKKQVTTCK